MSTHQCSMSLQCKSKNCDHATPHIPCKCDSKAPCGNWPNNSNLQPMVECIEVGRVAPRKDCKHCGGVELDGHHPQDCISTLQQRISGLEMEANAQADYIIKLQSENGEYLQGKKQAEGKVVKLRCVLSTIKDNSLNPAHTMTMLGLEEVVDINYRLATDALTTNSKGE